MLKEGNGVDGYRAFLSGDKTAAEGLVEAYSDAMIRFAYCYVRDWQTAEDIAEDAFAALFVRRKRFSDDDNFRAYLYKIVRNKSVDFLRQKKRTAAISEAENVSGNVSVETLVLDRERDRTIYACLQSIPKQYGEVLYLSYIEGYSISEICKIVGKSTKQVYNLSARAKIALKEALIKEGVRYEDL